MNDMSENSRRRIYNVRYERHDGYYGCVQSSGVDLTAAQAERRARHYLDAEGYPYKGIDEVYEVDSTNKRIG